MADKYITKFSSLDDLRPHRRKWTGNDANRRNHHGAVPLDEHPFDLILRWKRAKNDTPRLVGCFRLDLHALLADGYIREDKKPKHVRLCFVHSADGGIYVQASREKPNLRIGRVS